MVKMWCWGSTNWPGVVKLVQGGKMWLRGSRNRPRDGRNWSDAVEIWTGMVKLQGHSIKGPGMVEFGPCW